MIASRSLLPVCLHHQICELKVWAWKWVKEHSNQSVSQPVSQLSVGQSISRSVSQSVSLKMVSLADPSFWLFLVGESRTRLIYQSLQRLRGTFTVNGRRTLRISPNFEQIKIVSTNSLDENNEKLLICCRSKEQLKTSEGKLSDVVQIQIHVCRLPLNAILNLSGSILSVAERESSVR